MWLFSREGAEGVAEGGLLLGLEELFSEMGGREADWGVQLP